MTWLLANKEWLFQGIGATALVALLALFFRRRGTRATNVELSSIEDVFLRSKEGNAVPSPIWNAVAVLPGAKLIAHRCIFTEEEISKRIRVQVSSDRDGMTFWKSGDQSQVSVWLDIVNHNPFPITLDRIAGDITVNGASVVPIRTLDRRVIPAHSNENVHFSEAANSEQVRLIEFQLLQREDVPAGLNIRIYFQSEVRDLMVGRPITTGNCVFHNFSRRKRQHGV